jgi:hypothetical protein
VPPLSPAPSTARGGLGPSPAPSPACRPASPTRAPLEELFAVGIWRWVVQPEQWRLRRSTGDALMALDCSFAQHGGATLRSAGGGRISAALYPPAWSSSKPPQSAKEGRKLTARQRWWREVNFSSPARGRARQPCSIPRPCPQRPRRSRGRLRWAAAAEAQ